MNARRRQHIEELAREHNLIVGLAPCPKCLPEHMGGAVVYDRILGAWEECVGVIGLTHDPGESKVAYLVALHEIGHVVTGKRTKPNGHGCWRKLLALDAEAFAWRWALDNALITIGPDEWEEIRWRLETYNGDRRYKPTAAFEQLLKEATKNARGAGGQRHAA